VRGDHGHARGSEGLPTRQRITVMATTVVRTMPMRSAPRKHSASKAVVHATPTTATSVEGL